MRPTASLAKYLAQAGPSLVSSPLSYARADFEHERAGGHQVGLGVGDQRLDQLVLGDGLAALHPLGGEADGLVDEALREPDAQRGDVQPAVGEAGHRRRVAGAFGADQRLGADPDVVEVDVSGPGAGLAHLLVLRADRDTGRPGRHQEAGNPFGGRRIRVGTREDHEDVGHRSVGDVTLGAVDDPAVAVTHRTRLQPGRIGAGVGLGERERRGPLPRRHLRQIRRLLLVVRRQHQHVAGDAVVGAEHRAERRGGVAELEDEPRLLLHRQPEAAVLLGQREAEKSHVCSGFAHPLRDLVAVLDLRLERNDLVAHVAAHGQRGCRRTRRNPCADLLRRLLEECGR